MPLVNAKDLLQHAYQHHYAIAGIGITDLEIAQAAINAAEKSRSPVIFNLVAEHQIWLQLDYLVPSLLQIAKNSSVPVALHFDHLPSITDAKWAISLGCNSVMVELENKNLPTLVSDLTEFKDFCQQAGIALEVSAGHTSDEGDFTSSLAANLLTQPANAKYLAAKLQPDALAISIGNEHGVITKNQKIDFSRLRKIYEESQTPLVVHGGSGLTDDQCVRLTKKGVAKINFFSDVIACLTKVRKTAKDYFSARKQAAEELEIQLGEIMRLVGSAGRAAEVLQQAKKFDTQEVVIKAGLLTNNKLAVEQIELAIAEFSAGMTGLMSVKQFTESSKNLGQETRVWVFSINQQPDLVVDSLGYKKLLGTLQTQASGVEAWLS